MAHSNHLKWCTPTGVAVKVRFPCSPPCGLAPGVNVIFFSSAAYAAAGLSYRHSLSSAPHQCRRKREKEKEKKSWRWCRSLVAGKATKPGLSVRVRSSLIMLSFQSISTPSRAHGRARQTGCVAGTRKQYVRAEVTFLRRVAEGSVDFLHGCYRACLLPAALASYRGPICLFNDSQTTAIVPSHGLRVR